MKHFKELDRLSGASRDRFHGSQVPVHRIWVFLLHWTRLASSSNGHVAGTLNEKLDSTNNGASPALFTYDNVYKVPEKSK